MVTAETALALPSIMVVVGILIWIAVLVTAQVRVLDAARAGARAAARGESVDRVVAVAEDLAPPGARAVVTRSGTDVRVEVTVVVHPLGLSVLPAVEVDAVTFAAAEETLGLIAMPLDQVTGGPADLRSGRSP